MIPLHVAAYQPIWTTVPAQLGLPDPYLVAAIGDRESGWGKFLTPPGPEGTGDNGNGLGLMQIDKRYWADWAAGYDVDGAPIWQNPTENVRQGCRVLRAAWLALLSWPGVIAAYNAGQGRISRALNGMDPAADVNHVVHALNLYTTGDDYVSDVIRRWAEFKGENPIAGYDLV